MVRRELGLIGMIMTMLERLRQSFSGIHCLGHRVKGGENEVELAYAYCISC